MSYFNNLKTFVRTYELGSMSAAARDLRVSPAVASSRLAQLETHLNVRLFIRTTRALQPTEQGRLFYQGACNVLSAVDEAEAAVNNVTQNPKGSLYVAAPLGIGRRLIAPDVPAFKKEFPLIDIRLRLSDRKIDVMAEGLDVAFFIGVPEDSNLRLRKIADCERVLCASPDYIARKGHPMSGDQIMADNHDCLALRFPGTTEYRWTLMTGDGPQRYRITGPYESDDGDVLTGWALNGEGIVMKPIFEVADHLASGALVVVAEETPPMPVQLGCLYAHRRHQDPKVRLFIDFMAKRISGKLRSSQK